MTRLEYENMITENVLSAIDNGDIPYNEKEDKNGENLKWLVQCAIEQENEEDYN